MLLGHTYDAEGRMELADKEKQEPGPCLKDRPGGGGTLPSPAQLAVPPLPVLTEHIGGHAQQGVEHVMHLTVSLDHIG